jgi:tagatose 6-phosphate kinase
MCNILVDASTGQVLPVYERGLDFDAVEGEALRASILTSLQPGDWVVFSGSLPSGLEGSFLASLVTDAKAKGALTAVDASGEALIAAHLSAPTLLKINNEELAELTNSPVDRFACLDEVGKALLSEVSPAIPLAAVTLGPRGVVSRCGNTVFHHADGHLEVRNPVASGDILLGGLLAVLADKSPLLGTTPTFSDDDVDAAVRLGMSWAGSNCLHDFPHVELAEAERHATTITRSRLPI